MARKKRIDSKRVVLRKGESQRSNGTYMYRWSDLTGKRHTIYAKTLNELREKEKQIQQDEFDGIDYSKRDLTIDQLFEKWMSLKKGLKLSTQSVYRMRYQDYIKEFFGNRKVSQIRNSDVKKLYSHLITEKGINLNTLKAVNTILTSVLELAVDDQIIRLNPTKKVLRTFTKIETIQPEKKKALTAEEVEALLAFTCRDKGSQRLYPIIKVFLDTGLRVGELCALQWDDIDFENKILRVNKTLKRHNIDGSSTLSITPPKTKTSVRSIPMTLTVEQILKQEKENQNDAAYRCQSNVDGYFDFVFLNSFGTTWEPIALSKALVKLRKQYLLYSEQTGAVVLPQFSCHTFRHTFATRLNESGVNPKAIQTLLGHSDIATTFDVYTDITDNYVREEFISKFTDK